MNKNDAHSKCRKRCGLWCSVPSSPEDLAEIDRMLRAAVERMEQMTPEERRVEIEAALNDPEHLRRMEAFEDRPISAETWNKVFR